MNSPNVPGLRTNNNPNNEIAAHLRSKSDWAEIGEKRQQKLSTDRARKFSKLFEDLTSGVPSVAEAREAMAKALLKELEVGAIRKFREAGRAHQIEGAADLLEANAYARDLVARILDKLEANEFASSEKLQSYAGGIVRNRMLPEAYRRLKKFQQASVPLMKQDEDDSDLEYENPDITSNGMPLVNRSVDLNQLTMLDCLSTADSDFLDAYGLTACDIGKTAGTLGVTPAAARKSLQRLRTRLRTAELTEYLLDQFGADQSHVKTMANEILPLIKRMMQRSTVDYPKSWEEALSLPAIPKARRIEDDKPKSRWIQAVRSLYRLWESRIDSQQQTYQERPAIRSCRLQSL